MSERRESTGGEFQYWQCDDRPGAHGFTWSHYSLLTDTAGNYAIMAMQATDFRIRRAYQERERGLDEIARMILPFLAPRNVTPDEKTAPSPETSKP